MLPIPDLVTMTVKSLSSSLLRSGLTCLGVFMGVAAVNTTLNIQTISSDQITQQLKDRDNPHVIPWLYSEFQDIQLKEADRQALQQSIPIIRSISTLGEIIGIGEVQFEAKQVKKIHVNSVSLNYLETTGRKMIQGRFFNQADFEQYLPVAILDQRLAKILFDQQNPLNQDIFLADLRFVVVGVVETKSNELEPDSNGNLLMTANFGSVLQGDNVLDVMLQFILEAVLLSVIGGAIAIITVHGLTRTATTTLIEAPYKFSVRNAGLSMGAALLVGVGSSFFPALRATKVDIIKALKSE